MWVWVLTVWGLGFVGSGIRSELELELESESESESGSGVINNPHLQTPRHLLGLVSHRRDCQAGTNFDHAHLRLRLGFESELESEAEAESESELELELELELDPDLGARGQRTEPLVVANLLGLISARGEAAVVEHEYVGPRGGGAARADRQLAEGLGRVVGATIGMSLRLTNERWYETVL